MIFDHLANFRSEQMRDQNIAVNDAMILPFHANPAWIKFSKGDRKVSRLAVGFKPWRVVRSRRLFMAWRLAVGKILSSRRGVCYARW